MKLQEYFLTYEQAHKHPGNRLLHFLGIPSIIISLILIVFTPYSAEGWALFAVGWVFQFAGHALERTWPEFMKNPIYLLIGPLYFGHKLKSKFKD